MEQPPDNHEDRTTLTEEPWWGEKDREPPQLQQDDIPMRGSAPTQKGLHSKETREEDGGWMFSFLLLEFEKSYYNATFII